MFQGQGTNSLFDLKQMMLPYLALKIIFSLFGPLFFIFYVLFGPYIQLKAQTILP